MIYARTEKVMTHYYGVFLNTTTGTAKFVATIFIGGIFIEIFQWGLLNIEEVLTRAQKGFKERKVITISTGFCTLLTSAIDKVFLS